MSSATTTRPVPMPVRPTQSGGMAMVPIDPIRLLKRFWLALVVAAVVGAVVGFIANQVLKSVYPRWKTEVIYQISAPLQDPTKSFAPGEDRDEMERFLLTQSKVVTSDRILRSALVTSAGVFENDTKWGKRILDSNGKVEIGEGLNELKKVASAGVVSGTSLVTLSVTTSDPLDSAAIAKAIHEAYWTDYRSLSRNGSQETREPLQSALTQLRTELSRLDARRDQLLQERNIDELRNQKSSSEDVAIETLTPLVSNAAEQIARLTVLINQYQGLAAGPGGTISYPDEFRDLVERDAVVVEIKQRLTSLRNEIGANSQLGDDHPYNKSLKRRLESTEAELSSVKENQLRKIFDGELDRARRGKEAAESVFREQSQKLTAAIARKRDIVRTLATYDQIMDDRDRIQKEIERNNSALQSLITIGGINSADNSRVDRIRVLMPPQRPDELSFPKLTILLPLGIVAVVGLTAAFLVGRELLDQRIKGPSDITSIPRVRLLGIVPTQDVDPSRPLAELAFQQAPTGALADAYRQIRSPLIKRMQQQGYKSLLVVSGAPGSGASSVTCNLGLGSAASDQRVLLIDANFRRPALHRIFKLAEGPGLGEVLNRKISLEAAIQQTSTLNLHLLSAGAAANRALPERLSSELMAQVIGEAAGRYDLVIVDSAPLTIAGDAFAIANRVDASMLVVRAKNEKRGLIARLRDQLSDSRAEFLGVVVNGIEVTRSGYLRKNIEAAREYSATT